MKNKIKKIASAQAATLDVSLQTTDSVRHTMTTSNTAIAPCGTPCPTIPKIEILPPVSDASVLKDITIEEARGLNDGQLIEECKQRVRVAVPIGKRPESAEFLSLKNRP